MALKYDVVVVGAGPAGSATARFAAKGGCSVLMIEKRQEIGSPVRCGEGLARHFLNDIEMPYDRKWVAQEVKGAKLVSPAGHVLQIDEEQAGNEVGIVIERDMFDKACAKHAAKAGAEIWVKTTAVGLLKDNGRVTGVRVKRLEDEFDIHAKVVVGADGYESQVGRWAGIKTLLKAADITGTLQYRLTNIDPDPDFPNYCEFFLGSRAPAGYIWVFPKDECTANVGIGISLDHLHDRREIKTLLDAFVKKDPRMKHAQYLDMVTGGVSTCAPIPETVRDGIALVGDAARHIDPITGGGIGNGSTTGMILGKTLADIKQKGGTFSKQDLQAYEKGWRARLEETLYRNWMAKNKLVTISDEEFDAVIKTLSTEGIERLSVHAILKVVKAHHPDLVARFADLI